MDKLLEQLNGFGSPRVTLVGDFMIDRYVFGDAERISPEAPVPVLKSVRGETRIGGAGNVAAAMSALGAKVVCVGVRGDDEAGEELARLLGDAGADASGMIRVKGRATTEKTRYVGLAQHRHSQQLLRVDSECAAALDDKTAQAIGAAARRESKNCKVLALEDYGKGVLDDNNTPQIISEAREAGCVVVVDPARIDNYRRYRGASLLTPNRYETELASGIRITDEASLEKAARSILVATDAEAIVITLDREGAYVLERGAVGRKIATRPRTVYDVSGAGDIVLAALSVALAEGCSVDDAVRLSNVAGGLEVERFGVVAITRQEVTAELRRMIGLRRSKLVERSDLAREVRRLQDGGAAVVFTNGCFDLLHMGHVRYLQEARELGTCLVVAINSDASASRLKGPRRPIIGEAERAEMLAALECVDYVTVFDEDTPEVLLEMLHPDILAKGGTTPVIVGRDMVERYGGRVLTLELVEGLSTTAIIERILATHDDE